MSGIYSLRHTFFQNRSNGTGYRDHLFEIVADKFDHPNFIEGDTKNFLI